MFRRVLLIGAGSGILLIGLAAVTFGTGDSRLPEKAETFSRRSAHEVDSPSLSAAKRANPELKYFETTEFTIPADGRDDSFLRCPRGYKAINGYYGTDGGIVADFFAVGATSLRNWEFGLLDLTGVEGTAFLGLVCHD